ncbi:MAG: restriction endonuclease subunit S [Deltaproteobacteria bacterium]|nr:restriction endonuclease subunit S [Deltaproteobacteria bacterium]
MKQSQTTEATLTPNQLQGRFSEKDEPLKQIPEVETWAVTLQEIYDNAGLRLDASHYNRQTAIVVRELKDSKCLLKPLSELADLRLPGQFVRIWAEDKAYGFPYVNATDLMSLTGIGNFNGNPRYLSKETAVDIEQLFIHEGWLLMTCSGTIGRVFYVPKRLDGWVATHDLIRIIPNKETPVGFLHAYLSSSVAQKQITGHMHGGQIDHVTHRQIGEVLVPILPEDQMAALHNRTMSALEKREQAIGSLAEIADETQLVIKNE